VKVRSFLAVVGTVAGFIGGFLITFAIALQDQCPERDGLPCGDEWGGIIWAGALLGALIGGGTGWLIGRWSERR
jgi:hypothetical protein